MNHRTRTFPNGSTPVDVMKLSETGNCYNVVLLKCIDLRNRVSFYEQYLDYVFYHLFYNELLCFSVLLYQHNYAFSPQLRLTPILPMWSKTIFYQKYCLLLSLSNSKSSYLIPAHTRMTVDHFSAYLADVEQTDQTSLPESMFLQESTYFSS